MPQDTVIIVFLYLPKDRDLEKYRTSHTLVHRSYDPQIFINLIIHLHEH